MVGMATGAYLEKQPRRILEGAVWWKARSPDRANRCPAKGQPLQESYGVFLWRRPPVCRGLNDRHGGDLATVGKS